MHADLGRWMVLAGSLALAAGAPAQNALDRGQPNAPVRAQPGGRVGPGGVPPAGIPGRALDANLRLGSGGLNIPGRSFTEEVALRNAVVTGNVGGGRAFRGDVGYSAAGDFRGETGSDDLFTFQRDSAYSGLATQGIRGITPLQFQMTESTAGQTLGVLGELIIQRPSAAYTASTASGTDAESALTVDPYGNLRGSLRSTSEFLLRNARFPRLLGGLGRAEEGADQLYMTANPLIGVKAVTLGNPIFSIQERPDLMLPGGKRAKQGDRPGLSPAPVNPAFDARSPFDLLRERIQTRASQPIDGNFGDPGEAPPVEPVKPDPSIMEKYDRLIEDLRAEFRKKYSARPPASPDKRPGSPADLIPGTTPREEPKDEDEKSPVERLEEAHTTDPTDLIERARALLDSGEHRMQSFLEEQGADDLYTWHMDKGQEALITDRWFEAEERFTAALRAKPGDPMAAAARVHAQIGGSLFRSAGMNLRNLLRAYPDMLAAKYDERLLPRTQRLDGVRSTLRDRLIADSPFSRDAAFILAYLGFQTGNERDVFDAFAALDRFHADAKDEADMLERIAREVWQK
jgi:hypothetical protein